MRRVHIDLEARPDWWDRARCRGMGAAFLSASHAEQVAVCHGTDAPWARPCPVQRTCLEDLFRRTREYGWQELIDGDTVCGGLTPAQQRRVLSDARRSEKESKKSAEGGVRDPDDGVG